MIKKWCCWDNAVAESFFGSLIQERVHWRNYSTRFNAQQDILNYMSMWYNSHRLHSYLDHQSLNNFEQQNNELQKVA
jgi:transposase InsO family protein